MPLYIKSLTLDADRKLSSAHGGTQTWAVGQTVTIPVAQRGGPCKSGALHALRIQDLPFWLGSHYGVVEMPEAATTHENKVYGYQQTLVRVAEIDGLALLCDFADYCAKLGAEYDATKGAAFIAARLPAGFLDGVEA